MYRSYAKFNESNFLEELSQEHDNLIISQTDSTQNFLNWQNAFTKTFNKHAPLKSKRVKRDTQPEWLNNHIKSAMKNRDYYKKTNDWD